MHHKEKESSRCWSDGGEDGFFVCFEMMILVAEAMNFARRCARSVRMIISAAPNMESCSEKNALGVFNSRNMRDYSAWNIVAP